MPELQIPYAPSPRLHVGGAVDWPRIATFPETGPLTGEQWAIFARAIYTHVMQATACDTRPTASLLGHRYWIDNTATPFDINWDNNRSYKLMVEVFPMYADPFNIYPVLLPPYFKRLNAIAVRSERFQSGTMTAWPATLHGRRIVLHIYDRPLPRPRAKRKAVCRKTPPPPRRVVQLD